MLKQYAFPDKPVLRWGFALWLLGILMTTRDAMLSMAIWGFYPAQAVCWGLIGLGGIVFLAANIPNAKAIFTDRRFYFALFLTAVILLPAIMKLDWQLMYGSILIAVLFGVLVNYFATLEQVGKVYVWIMTFLSLYSLLATYALRTLAHAGIVPLIEFTNPGGWTFLNFVFAYPQDYSIRNFGIFREPGVYQFFILLAMYLANFRMSWKKVWHVWCLNGIFAVTIVSTFSTGGVLEFLLLAIFLYFDKRLYRKKTARIAALVAIVGVTAVLLIGSIRGATFFYEIVAMVHKWFYENASRSDRFGSVWVNLKFFLKNPIVGVSLREVLFGIDNNTSASTILLAVLGLLGGGINIAGWFALVWEKKRHWIGNCILTLILALSFNTCNIVTNPFFWLFPMMGICQYWLPNIRLPKKK